MANIYFPLISGRYPAWIPIWGGQDFLFFRPVFNLADSAITIGIFSIIIFYWRLFSRLDAKDAIESGSDKTDEAE